MPAALVPLSRADLNAQLLRLITDELERQNSGQRVRTVLGQRDLSYYNKVDDLIPLIAIEGLIGATGTLLVDLLPPPNVRPGGPFYLDCWLIEQEPADSLSSLERLPTSLLCIGSLISIRLGPEAGRYVVAEDSSADAPLLVSPDGFFAAGRPLVGAQIVADSGSSLRVIDGGDAAFRGPRTRNPYV